MMFVIGLETLLKLNFSLPNGVKNLVTSSVQAEKKREGKKKMSKCSDDTDSCTKLEKMSYH